MQYKNILIYNVAKNGDTHVATLATAGDINAEVVMIQEPAIYTTIGKWTMSHPNYNLFEPVSDWTERPRTLTYIRKDIKAQSLDQNCPDVTTVKAEGGVTFHNVYRPNHQNTEGAVFQRIFRILPGTRSFIAGDFNKVGLGLDTDTHRQNMNDFYEWCSDFTVVNDTERHTRGSSTLDFVITDIVGTTAEVREDLDCGSDHLPIVASIPGSPVRRSTVRTKPDLELLGNVYTEWTPTPSNDITEKMCSLQKHIQQAMMECTSIKKAGAVRHPWWDAELRDAVSRFRDAKRQYTGRHEITQKERRRMRGLVRRKKQAFWQRQVNDAKTDEEVFKMAKRRKNTLKLQPPPLEGYEELSQEESVTQIAKTLLLREQVDIPKENNVACNELDWQDLTTEEVRKATVNVKSTTPGSDGITAPALGVVWDYEKNNITSLFNECLRKGVHPFKESTVTLIPKQGKKTSNPKGWRPIALLSVLGKGLERAVAKRLANEGVLRSWFGPLQAGGIPGRSAVDLARHMVDRIEYTRIRKEYLAVILMDVRGAFDAANPAALFNVLRRLGVTESVAQWIFDFTQDRRIKPRRDQTEGDNIHLSYGVPQGSPLSPLAFSLLLSPSFRGNKDRYAYADDCAVIGAAKTPEEAITIAERNANQLATELRSNGLTLEPDKHELILFGLNKKKRENMETPTVLIEGKEVKAKDSVRYLGVQLNSDLKFKDHVQIRANKSQMISSYLKKLGGQTKGMSVEGNVKLIRAVLQPSLLYGSEVWWQGESRGQGYLVEQVDKAIRKVKRSALPVPRTCPNAVLDFETGIPSAETWLQELKDRDSLRLGGLRADHPLNNLVGRKTLGKKRSVNKALFWIEDKREPSCAETPSSLENHVARRIKLML